MPATNRLDQRFGKLQEDGKKAFVAYVCAGDPDQARSLDVIRAIDRAGADVIELGVPFSDPLADGIVNQMAAQRALESGVTVGKVLDLICDFRRESQTPIVLFTYLNPIYTYGFERFHADAAAAGADGILNLDLPPDEERENEELRGMTGLKHIRLIAPTTPDERIAEIASGAEGFVYYVSREGVTGEQQSLAEGIGEQVAKIKSSTRAPVVVGFGISSPDQASEVARNSDGVVVGSAIVKRVAEHAGDPDLATHIEAFVKPLVDAVKAV